jgi:hypothetical protein
VGNSTTGNSTTSSDVWKTKFQPGEYDNFKMSEANKLWRTVQDWTMGIVWTNSYVKLAFDVYYLVVAGLDESWHTMFVSWSDPKWLQLSASYDGSIQWSNL